MNMRPAELNIVAMIFEAQSVNPHGQDIGLLIHGMSFIVFGFLIFKSTFLPRVLGVLMAICQVGEKSVMLWLLVTGVNEQRWKAQADGARASTRS